MNLEFPREIPPISYHSIHKLINYFFIIRDFKKCDKMLSSQTSTLNYLCNPSQRTTSLTISQLNISRNFLTPRTYTTHACTHTHTQTQ